MIDFFINPGNRRLSISGLNAKQNEIRGLFFQFSRLTLFKRWDVYILRVHGPNSNSYISPDDFFFRFILFQEKT